MFLLFILSHLSAFQGSHIFPLDILTIPDYNLIS